MKKLVALALGTVMAVSMTAGVSAATVESKDDLKNATIGVQLGTTGDIEASEYEAVLLILLPDETAISDI